MLITNPKREPTINARALIDLVDTVGRVSYGGNLVAAPEWRQVTPRSVRLRVAARDSRGPGARTTWTGRHGPYACWHAYRDVIRRILVAYPHATVRTGLAVYRGRAGFEQTYPATARVNVGSVVAPAFMPALCDCLDDAAYWAGETWQPPTAWRPDTVAPIEARIDAILTGQCACGCGRGLAEDGPSDTFATEDCQRRWQAAHPLGRLP